MARYLIGIDNGSQSSKVTVFDDRGSVVCSAREPLRPTEAPRPGYVVHPDDDLWLSIAAASRRALAAFPGDQREIAAVGLCTIRFCRALLKDDGTLAAPVMSWMDSRVARSYEHTDHAVGYVTTSSGYITHRLTGQRRDTAANYQGVWPISTDRWEWLGDDEGFGDYGLRREMLFDLVMPGDLLGYVSRAASKCTGLPEGLAVFATANDKAVEALGCGLRKPTTLLVSLGTYIASMAQGESNITGAASFWTNFASVPHRYLYESHGIRRGMWTVSWWRDLLGEEALAGARKMGTSPEGYLDAVAVEVPPGSEGLMVTLDWLAPTGAPYKKGSILGFDGRHGRAHVWRAIYEGVALTVHRCAEAMGAELGREFDELVVSGGGSASDLFMHIFADVFGLPARRGPVNDAAGLGAAICAAVGHGLYPSWDAAADNMVRPGAAFDCDLANHKLYERMSAVHASIPELTDRVFLESYPLFG